MHCSNFLLTHFLSPVIFSSMCNIFIIFERSTRKRTENFVENWKLRFPIHYHYRKNDTVPFNIIELENCVTIVKQFAFDVIPLSVVLWSSFIHHTHECRERPFMLLNNLCDLRLLHFVKAIQKNWIKLNRC